MIQARGKDAFTSTVASSPKIVFVEHVSSDACLIGADLSEE
jgi:hypothetical protein